MSELESAIERIVDRRLAEALSKSTPAEPELITIDEAAEICGCGKDVIEALYNNADDNGFPAIRLGQRTIKIDRKRLVPWLNAGGLRSRSRGDRNVVSIGDRRNAA